jgi:hypothetical protein
MTDQERIIISAYTGYLMCNFNEVHKYIEQKMGRPVWTHEMAAVSFAQELRAKMKDDFLSLCSSNEPESK